MASISLIDYTICICSEITLLYQFLIHLSRLNSSGSLLYKKVINYTWYAGDKGYKMQNSMASKKDSIEAPHVIGLS